MCAAASSLLPGVCVQRRAARRLQLLRQEAALHPIAAQVNLLSLFHHMCCFVMQPCQYRSTPLTGLMCCSCLMQLRQYCSNLPHCSHTGLMYYKVTDDADGIYNRAACIWVSEGRSHTCLPHLSVTGLAAMRLLLWYALTSHCLARLYLHLTLAVASLPSGGWQWPNHLQLIVPRSPPPSCPPWHPTRLLCTLHSLSCPPTPAI